MRIYDKIVDYMSEMMPNFETKGKLYICPFCANPKFSFQIFNSPDRNFSCYSCNMRGTLVDIVKKLENNKSDWSKEQITEYLSQKYNIVAPVKVSEVEPILDVYHSLGFDLVQVKPSDKVPIEKKWPEIEHKDKEEWKRWLGDGLNIGVKTGKSSGITVIDVDTQELPDEIKPFLTNYKGMLQKTAKGYHYFFQYEPDLPKSRLDKLHIDLENDGGQVVINPSEVEGNRRSWLQQEPIPKMSDELKDFLKKMITLFPKPKLELETTNNLDISEVGAIGEGGRNNFLIKMGGILRKDLNLPQTANVLNLMNKIFCKPALPPKELDIIFGSLDKYINYDHQDLRGRILSYMRTVGDASARDVKEITGEKKELVDKALAGLVREGFITKKRHVYYIIKKADWKDEMAIHEKPIQFKVPYFEDIANFCIGDLILLGSKSKIGKTTISMNVVKTLIDQGIKPYYICLETGSRFVKTAKKIGIVEGEFWWDFQADPTKIELEKNAVTIIDWLMIEDKAMTDSVLKHFVEQLFKTDGVLIIFMQLKRDGTWFAPNMVEQFPALSARYIYENEEDGTYGAWHVDSIRDPKYKIKKYKIPCIYDFDNRTLTRIEQ